MAEPIEQAERLDEMLLAPLPLLTILTQIGGVAERGVRHRKIGVERNRLPQQVHLDVVMLRPKAVGVEPQGLERCGRRARQSRPSAPTRC